MAAHTTQQNATLLDILIDGFEKNEILYGFHWRNLPMPDEAAAAAKFAALREEAQRWKGPPARIHDEPPRRIAAWPDLEIRQAGRGIRVRVRAPWFNAWWHDARTWQDDPMEAVAEWIEEERRGTAD